LSALIGESLTTIDDWRRKGCPFLKKGNNVVFSVPKVVQWKRKGDSLAAKIASERLDLVQEQARLAKARADDQEMKNAVRRGELIDVEDVVAAYAPFGREVRQRLLAMGSVVGPRVGKSVEEQRRISAAINAETFKALKALSEYEFDPE
jgi:phage terminase Nu1 subunit (DNA packaging protein)